MSRLPHVLTCHDSPLTIARYSGSVYRWLRAGMAWHVLRRARCVTTVSPYMVREVGGWCRSAPCVVANPISRLAFDLQRRGGAVMGGARLAMVSNGWGARKNPQAALRAFALVRAHWPDARLHLYGSDYGPGQRAEQWAVAQGCADGVVFEGALPHAQLLRRLAECDLLLHSSLEESFGVALVEAMAIGLPVVAGRDSGAVPWLVGDAGLLVDVRDPNALAHAACRLLADPQLRRRQIDRGCERARQFSADAVAAAYEPHYAAALRQRDERATARLGGVARHG